MKSYAVAITRSAGSQRRPVPSACTRPPKPTNQRSSGRWISQGLPRFSQSSGAFDLAATGDLLREHAVLVAHAVAERRQAERGEGVEEARGEPAEAAVAERGVGLALEHIGQRRAGVLRRFAQRVVEAECGHGVAERAAHQEFHRQVVHAAR